MSRSSRYHTVFYRACLALVLSSESSTTHSSGDYRLASIQLIAWGYGNDVTLATIDPLRTQPGLYCIFVFPCRHVKRFNFVGDIFFILLYKVPAPPHLEA